MSTHNIDFYEDLTKIIFELPSKYHQISNMHLISSAEYSWMFCIAFLPKPSFQQYFIWQWIGIFARKSKTIAVTTYSLEIRLGKKLERSMGLFFIDCIEQTVKQSKLSLSV